MTCTVDSVCCSAFCFPFPQINIIGTMMIVWRVRTENYQVYSVQYCMQQLCTVQCTHIWTDLAVVCWLDLAFFLWFNCVLQFICDRFSCLGLFCRPTILCVPSVLFVVWQEEHSTCKNWVVRYWRGYLFGARCKRFAYGPADAIATPSSLAPVKSRMVYLSGADLPRLSWKRGC